MCLSYFKNKILTYFLQNQIVITDYILNIDKNPTNFITSMGKQTLLFIDIAKGGKLTNADEVGILGGSFGIVIALFGGTLLSILLHRNDFLRKVLFGYETVISNY